eukprot:3066636-Prymnesium_polylepis.1
MSRRVASVSRRVAGMSRACGGMSRHVARRRATSHNDVRSHPTGPLSPSPLRHESVEVQILVMTPRGAGTCSN